MMYSSENCRTNDAETNAKKDNQTEYSQTKVKKSIAKSYGAMTEVMEFLT